MSAVSEHVVRARRRFRLAKRPWRGWRWLLFRPTGPSRATRSSSAPS